MIGQQITAEDLHAILEQGLTESILIDVRTPEEFSRGAIVGAKNIPVDQIMNSLDILRPYKKIYLYCLSGGRSQLASAQLGASDIKGELVNLESGILGWRKQGYTLK
jgi:rhodanese-related sulfurtransferase